MRFEITGSFNITGRGGIVVTAQLVAGDAAPICGKVMVMSESRGDFWAATELQLFGVASVNQDKARAGGAYSLYLHPQAALRPVEVGEVFREVGPASGTTSSNPE